jgi:hypothetical protein
VVVWALIGVTELNSPVLLIVEATSAFQDVLLAP